MSFFKKASDETREEKSLLQKFNRNLRLRPAIALDEENEEHEKPAAIAFVDYEHWHYAMGNHFGLLPDVRAWRDEICELYDVKDIQIYGDFSYGAINSQMNTLRSVTNHIISTQNSDLRSEKDMTDFIILDAMYQSVIDHPDIDVWILFTGDGHFQSVVKFLRHRCNKEVIVYGVKNCFNKWLKDAASQAIVIPDESMMNRRYRQMIIDNFEYVSNNPDKEIVPTFMSICQYVSKFNDISRDLVKEVLESMIEDGLVFKSEKRMPDGKIINSLRCDWNAVEDYLRSFGEECSYARLKDLDDKRYSQINHPVKVRKRKSKKQSANSSSQCENKKAGLRRRKNGGKKRK